MKIEEEDLRQIIGMIDGILCWGIPDDDAMTLIRDILSHPGLDSAASAAFINDDGFDKDFIEERLAEISKIHTTIALQWTF